jgi:GNAT superfamily N-acetyltransferase
MRIRNATVEDLPLVCELGFLMYSEHAAALPHLFPNPDSPSRDFEFWRARISEVNGLSLVAEMDGRSVGFAFANIFNEAASSVAFEIRYCRLRAIMVSPNARREGLAIELISEVEKWAATQGCSEVRINTQDFNSVAKAAYEASGYGTLARLYSKVIG